MGVIVIDNENTFNNAISSNELVIVYFTAKWCGPCKKIFPTYKKLASIEHRKIFLKVDVDDNEDLATKYNIQSIPTFIFFKNGQQVDILNGSNDNDLVLKTNNLI